MKPLLRWPLLLCALAGTLACSPKIMPVPTATALLNPADQSLTETRDGVAVSVRIDQQSVQPYQLTDNLTSFQITIDNRSAQQVTFPHDAFLLRAGDGQQYRSITPERVREIVSKDTVYLIPHPYVGYYYLQDQERFGFENTMTSSLPYYAEYHPQEIFTRALPVGAVLPQAKVAGVIYFVADLSRMPGFELQLFADAQMQGSPLYRFPFAVEK
jgi:hypothetical protein